MTPECCGLVRLFVQVVHEHRGEPDGLVVCHLPHGPTASFSLSSVVMRHDIPDAGTMSEVCFKSIAWGSGAVVW